MFKIKITVTGGGTAGWIAALFFLKAQPGLHEVTVIESSKIGIIGAGEGSTGTLADLLKNMWFDTGININDFISNVDGTIKLGIKHKNWTGDGSSYFAPLDGSPTSSKNPDVNFLKTFSELGVDGMHTSSEIGMSYEAHVFPENYALHFDGHKVGQYIKSKLANEKLTVIDSVVKDIVLSEDGNVDYLVLENGQIEKSDFYVDSSGFSRIFSKALNINWVSYKDNLPVNRAMPFLVNYKDDEIPEPLTTAHALSSGWMWDIPLQTRRGCGYVYDKNYISDKDAQKEIEEYLGHSVTPIKFIDFEAGRSEVFWKKNCLLLGLSAAFAEPLEATSIHTTIIQLLIMSFEFMTDSAKTTITDKNINRYNARVSKMYDDIKDFLVVHYQGGRADSDFWKSFLDNKRNTDFSKEVLEKTKNKIPGVFQFDYYFGSVGAPLWNWILAGTGKISKDQAKKELKLYGH